MSGALKEVRNRIKSVQSTQQITKAMKMVSAAKLRRAQDAIIQIVNGPTQADSRMVEVLWDGHPLIMFVEDIQQRGEDVTGKSATA